MYYYGKQFKKCVDGVSEKFPLTHRKIIRTVKLDGLFGEYEFDDDDNLHIIRIAKKVWFSVAVDTFIHEYAHALDNQRCNYKLMNEVHSAEWGKIYARIYRWYHGKNELTE